MNWSIVIKKDFSSCGVGLLTSLTSEVNNENLQIGINALKALEHRGGKQDFGDGAGIMTSIPFDLLGIEPNKYAIASIFGSQTRKVFNNSIGIFEQTFNQFGLQIKDYREVKTNNDAINPKALSSMPVMLQAIIKRPSHCRTIYSFEKLLYFAKQLTMARLRTDHKDNEFYFTSLSPRTIVYKAMCTSDELQKLFLDLQDPNFKTSFALFHRRFSTNTNPSWKKVQPFKLIAHNGEINTIRGNKLSAISREKAIGLRKDELVTRDDTSDSETFNEVLDALKYRSSIPNTSEALAIMMPPSKDVQSDYFKFWSRAMEPWDGPALVAYCDGKHIGARLDRNGFRPSRWQKTEQHFFLSSEAGIFPHSNMKILEQGILHAGRSVTIHALKGTVSFQEIDTLGQYKNTTLDSRTMKLPYLDSSNNLQELTKYKDLFPHYKDDYDKILMPSIIDGATPIGSMGNTARPAFLSELDRSLFDYFFQDFSQVTNPPLDYLREGIVTNMNVYLGRKPNIFEPKELIPPSIAFELPSPILSLGQLEYITSKNDENSSLGVNAKVFDILFDPKLDNNNSFNKCLSKLTDDIISSVKNGINIIVLSDRQTNENKLPIPSLIALRAVQLELNRTGRRLRVSIIVDTGDVLNAHQGACLVAFGASAVCPYLALSVSREVKIENLGNSEKEQKLIGALNSGVKKIMAKKGVSVIRSYQGSELLTPFSLGGDIIQKYFPGHRSIIKGKDEAFIINNIIKRSQSDIKISNINSFIHKEHPKSTKGELHSISTSDAKEVHKVLNKLLLKDINQDNWNNLVNKLDSRIINLKDLLTPDYLPGEIDLDSVEKEESILKTFGLAAMSFGAINAKSQKDLLDAFHSFGGRTNSGEGGQNPYFLIDGTTATCKQMASGRFGVTAEYLLTGREVQIKIAQGAKPGEGGQLMAIKVDKEIALARHASANINLISPPPHHDIYSIEDLKQLIYEIKNLNKNFKVSVKLVSSEHIGTISIGVVKAGADIIHISGGNGGTGAADKLSMKHTGLPFEFGLLEVHRSLVKNNLREHVLLRVDGGLQTARDIIIATILGAEEYDFGRIALISQGCIMARVCEKNTCPTGIATQNPKFQSLYKGNVENISNYFSYVSRDIRIILARLGKKSLRELVGMTSILKDNPDQSEMINKLGLNLNYFQGEDLNYYYKEGKLFDSYPGELNQEILDDLQKNTLKNNYKIKSTDRAIPATAIGELVKQKMERENSDKVLLNFNGSAGQGFGVFCQSNIELRLVGVANDSVAKGMSGGNISVSHPYDKSKVDDIVIGNSALYGATGGVLLIGGSAGDRFAVRNSGAKAVLYNVGMHACEYMTGGIVVILGKSLENIGAGMTGGVLYINSINENNINKNYLQKSDLEEQDILILENILGDYCIKTGVVNNNWVESLDKYIPINNS
ncbi:MAG: glutamate synthase large subunit [Bdellovibrionales bacterium]|nr:glutamate synthase large subunit [Bdellovibrionales bacterium]